MRSSQQKQLENLGLYKKFIMDEQTPVKSKKKLRYVSNTLLLLALFSVIFGSFKTINEQHQNNVAIQKAIHNPGAPSTSKPTLSAFANYTVPSPDPRYLFIPSINVKATVGAVGLTKTGAIGTPDNVYDTAWYNQSSHPGQPGASWTTNGVFHDLDKLKVGDNIQVEQGDGTLYTYSVAKIQTYRSNTITGADLLQPINSTKPGLNLITCTGDVIKGTNEFNERVVIYAQQTASS
jgi:LPXTG-site transpeptidase (sortase) family protein